MNRSQTIQNLFEKARESFIFSAYQALASCRNVKEEWFGGQTSYWPGAQPVTAETFFDIGSVTKAVVTTSLCALSVDQRKLALADLVGERVPEWGKTPLASLSVRDLLTHSAGLIPWFDFAASTVPQEGMLSWAKKNASQWIAAPAGTQTAYSDVGFLVLGEVLQAVWKDSLESLFNKHIVQPLCLKQVQYAPLLPNQGVAATEVREGTPLQGSVFDENSAALGGKTAHAGLFATARGLAPWCDEWLKALQGKSSWLTPETAALFTQRQDRVQGSSWALGWDTKSAQGSSAGQLFSGKSFGHLGYPGCSVWFDPQKQGYLIFWSNRVHPSRLDERIRKFRPLLHDAVASGWA